ncbi:MAG: Tex-like N-terminal domain-containing protein, partial [Planctomycetota bacterium]
HIIFMPSEEAKPDGAEPKAEGEAKPDEAEPEAEGKAKPEEAKPKPAASRPPRRERRPPPRPHHIPLTLTQRTEARENAKQRLLARARREPEQARAALDLIDSGKSIVFGARFRRAQTGGMDERGLRALRDLWEETLREEERRIELAEVLRSHGALDEETTARLRKASSIPLMEDLAAPHLPVRMGRATMARGLGLEGLAEAIRNGDGATELGELAQGFVKEDEEPKTLDAALAGARDILAEEMSLDVNLRGRLREVFRKHAVLTVALGTGRKGDPGRHKNLVGFHAPATRVPPLKFLGIRRAEKDRVLLSTIEAPEDTVLSILHEHAAASDHPHVGFLRAAMEDGYRRILKPLYQAEIRGEMKQRADTLAMETFERTLRHRLLGPVGGRRHVLGLRPDVQQGHRWCAVDPGGLPTGSGQLPHEGTAGREACITELREVLRTYEIEAVAVGSGASRAEALSLANEAVAGRDPVVPVAVVSDGGTHILEAQGKIEIERRPEVPAHCRGAFSLARRFQDPLAELVGIDPMAWALGPHLHEVRQGRLRRLLDET